jgi:hypothetical protein
MQRRRKLTSQSGFSPRFLMVGLLAVLPATPALANAGTPLMWAGMLHLFVSNAFIGVMEGLLLDWVLKLAWLIRGRGLVVVLKTQ